MPQRKGVIRKLADKLEKTAVKLSVKWLSLNEVERISRGERKVRHERADDK